MERNMDERKGKVITEIPKGRDGDIQKTVGER